MVLNRSVEALGFGGDFTVFLSGLDGGFRREGEVQELSWRPQDNFKELVDNYRPRFVR